MQDLNTAQIISSKPFKMRILFRGVPASANQLLGRHWRTKHKKAMQWQNLVHIVVGYNKPNRPIEKCKLTFIRHSSRNMDFDGMALSLKPIVDGLVNAGILLDDRYSITGNWTLDQQFRPRKMGQMMEVFVEEVELDRA